MRRSVSIKSKTSGHAPAGESEASLRRNRASNEGPWLGKRPKPPWTLSKPFQTDEHLQRSRKLQFRKDRGIEVGELGTDSEQEQEGVRRPSKVVVTPKASTIDEETGESSGATSEENQTTGDHHDRLAPGSVGVDGHEQAIEHPTHPAGAVVEEPGSHYGFPVVGSHVGEVGGGPVGHTLDTRSHEEDAQGNTNLMERLAQGRGRSYLNTPQRTRDDILDDRHRIGHFEVKEQAMREVREAEEQQNAVQVIEHPNWWFAWRRSLREPLSEFLATFVMIFIGIAGQLQMYTSQRAYGGFTQMAAAWGVGVTLGVHVAGGVSGGHVNPLISVDLFVFRGFPLRKCLTYIAAQILAAFAAIAIVHALYRDAILDVDPGLTTSASTDSTGKALFSLPGVFVRPATAFFSDFTSAALLSIATLAVGDSNNSPPGAGMHAFVLGVINFGIIIAMGYNTGPQVNPAKDLASRLVGMWVGYGHEMWEKGWYWEAWGAAFSGGLSGCLVYDVLIYEGRESPVNYPRGTYSWQNVKGFVAELQAGLVNMIKAWSKLKGGSFHMRWRKRILKSPTVDAEKAECTGGEESNKVDDTTDESIERS